MTFQGNQIKNNIDRSTDSWTSIWSSKRHFTEFLL